MGNFKKATYRGKKNPMYKDGLSWLERKELLAGSKRPAQCDICGAMGKICFDHDHNTGQFRGWLCVRCNFALGLVKDNVEILNAMILYLNKGK